MSDLLTVQNLCKSYGVKKNAQRKVVNAVDNVTFSLKPGDNLGIIGASGSGKTTLIKMILGLTPPTSGIVIKNIAAGFVAQDPYSSLSHALTIEEIVAEPLIFSGKYRRASQCLDEVEKVLSGVNLSYATYAKRYAHQLSGGQRQRVSIARALIGRPGLLVLDEPTSMIDFESKMSIVEIIKNLAADFKTSILLVTHDITVAKNLCDTILVMNGGKIIESGAADEIIVNPRHEYTKRLIMAGSDVTAYWEAKI